LLIPQVKVNYRLFSPVGRVVLVKEAAIRVLSPTASLKDPPVSLRSLSAAGNKHNNGGVSGH